MWAASLSQATFISYSLINSCPARYIQKDNLWWYKCVLCSRLQWSLWCLYNNRIWAIFYSNLMKHRLLCLGRAGKMPRGRCRHCAEQLTLLGMNSMVQRVMQQLHPACTGQGMGAKELGIKVPNSHSRETQNRNGTKWARNEAKRARNGRNKCKTTRMVLRHWLWGHRMMKERKEVKDGEIGWDV